MKFPVSARGPPPPDPLYKYALRKDAISMMERGSFMIGTLYDFRNVEKYGSEMGDAGEGTWDVTQHVDDASWDEIKDSPIVSSNVFIAPGEAGGRFINTDFGQQVSVEDFYIFCVSKEPTKQALVDFGKEVCIRISTPILFFRALTHSLIRAGKIALTGQSVSVSCVYGGRAVQWEAPQALHPAQLKPEGLAYQKEYRKIWVPASRPIKREIIECPEAKQFLSIHPL